jgi:hypothetical protein
MDRHDALMDLGMDSLKAVEAKFYLETELDIELGSSLLYDHPTIDYLTEFLLGALALDGQPVIPAIDPSVAPAPAVATGDAGDDVDDLSTDEVAALLAAELASISRLRGQ